MKINLYRWQTSVVMMLMIAVNGMSQQTTVRISVKNYKDSIITYTPPVEGTVFWRESKDVKLNTNGSVEIHPAIKESGLFNINLNGDGNSNYQLFIQPGDEYDINIDAGESNNLLEISGRNSEGNQLLNILELPYFYSVAREYQKDSTLSDAKVLRHKMDSLIKNGIAPYKKLLLEKKIDSAFYTYAATSISYYHALIFATVIGHYQYQTHYPKSMDGHRETLPPGLGELWTGIFKKYPVNNPAALKFKNFRDYAVDNYINQYKEDFSTKKKWDFDSKKDEKIDENEYLRLGFNKIKTHFKGKFAEALLAQEIDYQAMQSGFQIALIKEFESFKFSYPRSGFTAGLQQQIDPVKDYHKKIKADFTIEEKFIKDYNKIDSMPQLLAYLKGQPVFIDVWATWCGPCKEEFKYKDSLLDFIKANNVTMVYISIDEENRDKQWKEMIKYYGLSGNHVRASESFAADLRKLYNENGSISIPWYIIADKEGNIVVQHAMRPSEKGALYEQLKGYL